MSNRRAAEPGRLHELPRHLGTGRGPEAASRRADHEVDYLEQQAVVRRHLKPILRFLTRLVGRRWADVAHEVEARCRASRCPPALRDRLLPAVVRQVGADGHGRCSLNLPRPVFVDPRTGVIRRGDGLSQSM